jgi:hypothetical protein
MGAVILAPLWSDVTRYKYQTFFFRRAKRPFHKAHGDITITDISKPKREQPGKRTGSFSL